MIRRAALISVPFLLTAGWMLLASALCTYFTHFPFEPFGWWAATQLWWGANWFVTLCLVMSAAAPGFLVIFAVAGVWQHRRQTIVATLQTPHPPTRPVDTPIRTFTNNLGDADWAADEENTRRWRGPNNNWGGVPVGERYNPLEEPGAFEPYDRSTWGKGGTQPLLIDDGRQGSTHSMVISGSGGGKSMSIVTNLLTWKGPVVVFDPAGELAPMVRRAREAMGHKVIVLDPQTSAVSGINGCGHIKPSSRMAEIALEAQVERVCGATPSKGDGGSNENTIFFKNRGKSVVTAVLGHILWDPNLPPHLKTLSTMRSLLAAPETQVKTLLRNIHQTSESRLARQLAGSFSDSKAEETFSGVLQSAEEDTRWISIEAYGDLVSGDALQTSDILDGNTDVFLSLPLVSEKDTPKVARLILGAMLGEIYAANGLLDTRWLFEIDEAWILGPFEPFNVARPAGRKYGVTLQLFYTAISDVQKQWGALGAKSWFSDVSWCAFSGLNELQAARELSEAIGDYGILRRSESENTGRSGRGMQIGSRSRGRSVTYSESARRLIQTAEILRKLRADATIVLPRSGPAAILGQHLYFRRPEFNGMVDDNRFAKAPSKGLVNARP